MSLKFYLTPNSLTADPNTCSARVISNRVLDTHAVIQEMLHRRTSLTEPDIIRFLGLLFEVITDVVADGNTVNLPLVKIRPGISGTFTHPGDRFNKKRHNRHASVSAGILLRKKMAEAKTEKIQCPMVAPQPIAFTDVSSGLENERLTPGRIGRIVGRQLKFAIDNSAEGVFFIGEAGIAARAAYCPGRTEAMLVFDIPETLAAGTYSLEVRKGYGSKNNDIRTGRLADKLVVM